LDEATRLEQEELDVKCLQLLRATIHNEIVKLPVNWEDKGHKLKRFSKRQLVRITDMQNFFLKLGVMEKVLPLLARSNDEIVRETLACLSTVLFNANAKVQVIDESFHLCCYSKNNVSTAWDDRVL
jgi:inositol 1,4,5-triphosphate receptor type 1